ncbi:MAG: CPBP family intramembrane glutamic endopeptidase [Planctomycetota bacterium]
MSASHGLPLAKLSRSASAAAVQGPPASTRFTPQSRATVVLAITAPLLLLWKYYGSQGFFQGSIAPHLSLSVDPAAVGAFYRFGSAFLLLGVIPAIVVKAVFREQLRDYGVGPGIVSQTLSSIAMLSPVFAIAAWIGSFDPGVRAVFPINPQACASAAAFATHAAGYVLFYLGWEFYFRGFLQHGVREAFGDWNAILVQVAASALLHIGDPAAEAFGAIAAGLLWGMLAFRTRSLLSGTVQHAVLGITLDAWICYGPA